MNSIQILQTIVIWAIPVVFAITLHEVAHGWVANLLGDPTAKRLGRLTVNPVKHIDPLGTLILPLLMALTTNFIFGWAKPVPITWENLKKPKRDMALVAVAGPGANLVMAIFWVFLLKLSLAIGNSHLHEMARAGVLINVILIALNMLPIPPLDGSRIVSSFLSGRLAWYYSRIEPYGFIILIVLLITHILPFLMFPIVHSLYGFLTLLV